MTEDTCVSNVRRLSMRTPRLRTQLELKTDKLPKTELLNSALSDGPKIIISVLESLRVKKLLVSQSLTSSRQDSRVSKPEGSFFFIGR